MFNVRPDALSPWLYVNQIPIDNSAGFRAASDGSVDDQQDSTAFIPFGFNPRAASAPAPGAGFEDAIRSIVDPATYLSQNAAGLAPLPRVSIQEALEQIARIYANASTGFDRQDPGDAMAVPAGVQPHPSYAQYLLPSAPEPAAQGLRRSDNYGSPQLWLQTNLPTQSNRELQLGRAWLRGGSLPTPAIDVSDGSPGTWPMRANDVQVAQTSPVPQQRRQNPSVVPRLQKPASELGLQVQATQRFNTQLARASTWNDVIRQPLPEKIAPRMQKPLPDDWEGTLNKINPHYVKWTTAAAEKKTAFHQSCLPDYSIRNPTTMETGRAVQERKASPSSRRSRSRLWA